MVKNGKSGKWVSMLRLFDVVKVYMLLCGKKYIGEGKYIYMW